MSDTKNIKFQIAWINRFGQPPEYLEVIPNAKIRNFDELPPLLGL